MLSIRKSLMLHTHSISYPHIITWMRDITCLSRYMINFANTQPKCRLWMCAFVCLKLFFHAPSVNINTIRFEDSSLCYAYILSTKSNDVVLLLSLFYWIYSLRHFSCLSIMGFFRRIFLEWKASKKHGILSIFSMQYSRAHFFNSKVVL